MSERRPRLLRHWGWLCIGLVVLAIAVAKQRDHYNQAMRATADRRIGRCIDLLRKCPTWHRIDIGSKQEDAVFRTYVQLSTLNDADLYKVCQEYERSELATVFPVGMEKARFLLRIVFGQDAKSMRPATLDPSTGRLALAYDRSEVWTLIRRDDVGGDPNGDAYNYIGGHFNLLAKQGRRDLSKARLYYNVAADL